MAQGDLTLFEEMALNTGNGNIDLDTDTFKMALITTLPTASQTTPQLGDFTEVTGSGYTAGGETLTTTYTESGGTTTFDATGTPAASWTQNGSGPTNIVAGLIYSDTSTGDLAIAFVDFTTDGGSTAISLQAGDISWTPNASGIYTVS